MQVIRSPIALRSWVKRVKKRGETVGFVPTMGALHEGHLSLVRAARRECDKVVVSIFVNPLQFGPKEDFNRYPKPFSDDKILLQKEKADLLFFPSVRTMVPDVFLTDVTVGCLTDYLCGPFRPGHFEGVATVCAKLFNLVVPDAVYFGQKDYQQTRVVAQMLKDLDFPIRMKVVPTVREKNGLAMSSRNRYLKGSERESALLLYRALSEGKAAIQKGERNPSRVLSRMKAVLGGPKVKVQYLSVADPSTLAPLSRIKGSVLLAGAAYVGKTRLIDNLLVRI